MSKSLNLPVLRMRVEVEWGGAVGLRLLWIQLPPSVDHPQ